jgi:hypothetical protein
MAQGSDGSGHVQGPVRRETPRGRHFLAFQLASFRLVLRYARRSKKVKKRFKKSEQKNDVGATARDASIKRDKGSMIGRVARVR